MLFLEQSTAVTVKIGPFLDSTDGNTAETGLTISQADVRLSKNGANIAQKNESSSCTHDELGIYGCDLDTTDTGTLGRLQLWVHESGALQVWHEFMVVPSNVYDSLYGSDLLEVDVQAVDGDETAAANLELDYDGTGYAKANSTIGTVTTLNGHTAQTGDNYARLGAPAGASIAADIAEVEGQTDDIGAAGAGLSAVPWNAAWDAEVQSEVTDALNAYDPPTKAELDSGFAGQNDLTAAEVNAEVDTALTDIHLDHLLAATYDPASKPGAADALLNEIVENDSGVSRFTVNALENAPSGTGASAATIADAVWDEALADHVGAGSTGKQLSDVALTDELPSSPPSAAAIADQVWEEAIADHSGTGGSTAEALDGASAPTAAAVADAVLDEALSGHTGAGSLGKAIADIESDATDILADSGELQTDWTNGGRLDLIIDAILVDTAEIGAAGAGLSAVPWNAAWDAEVQSEVTDALNAYDPPTKAELDSGLAALNDPTAAAISDVVWDELMADHQVANTMGKQLSDVALTDELPNSPPTVAQIRAEMDSNSTQLAAIVADTGALNDTALPDSVPADGSLPTLKQAVYMINQFLMERSVAGTTVDVKKVDGSTTLMTFTLNDGTSPTSISRAT